MVMLHPFALLRVAHKHHSVSIGQGLVDQRAALLAG